MPPEHSPTQAGAGNGPEAEISFDNKEYKIISTMRLSAWEDCYHVQEPDTKREMTLLTLKKDKHVKQLENLIEESGDWDSDREIRPKALEKFEELNQKFRERYSRLLMIPPHRALPQVFKVFKDIKSDQFFVVQEYVFGVPFLIASGGLSPLQNLGLIRELLEGLDYMHDNGLLHRRIKSKNIFVHYEGTKPMAKFSTWGLAVPIAQAQEDRSGAIEYTAPEVLLKGKISKQVDLWAVASLLYQALTREQPFPERSSARNLEELAHIAKGEEKPNALRAFECFQKLNPQLEGEWKVEQMEELLFDLLKPNPEERRFKNARHVINFIDTHWPMVKQGAPEASASVTLSVAKHGD